MSATTPLLAEHRAHGGASETLGADKEDCGSNPSAGLAKKSVQVVCSDSGASAIPRNQTQEPDSKKPDADSKKLCVEAKKHDRTGHGGASETHGAEKKKEDCGSTPSAGLAKKPVHVVCSDPHASVIPRTQAPKPHADSKKPYVQGTKHDEAGSSDDSSSEDSKKAVRTVGKKLNADTLADAVATLAQKFRNPAVFRIGNVFASRARKFAANPKDVSARERLVVAGQFLGLATKHTTPDAQDVQDILEVTNAVLENHFLPASVWTAHINEKKIEEPNLRRLRVQARNFCDLAVDSSMADAAVEFSRAVEKHAAGKDRGKKVAETYLLKAGLHLFQASREAPPIESALAGIALRLTQDSDMILLTPDGTALKSNARTPLKFCTEMWGSRCLVCDILSGRCRCCCGCWSSSMLKWIRSGPELTLPIHHKHQSKLAGKRQVLYAIALGTPLALLTSAASLNIFPSGYGTWIAVATVFIWLLVSGGMVANQYGTTNLELIAAINLGRLGMLAVCVLLCVYAFWAFFPTHTYILWFLLVFAALVHGVLCIMSRSRGDDDILTVIQMAEKLEAVDSSK